jgi:ABC-2 type transport system permease protein
VDSVATDLSETIQAESSPGLGGRLKHTWRLVTVLVGMEIKLRYGDSALGYVWTIGKPMLLFSILYVVFGQLVRFSAHPPHYALYLVIGVMLWSFFADGTTRTMNSIVSNGSLLRKLPFPRLVVPLAASLTSFVTFGLSLIAIAVFVGANEISPTLEWPVLLLDLIELYLFVLGLGLVLAVIYVHLRDIAQVWELGLQLLFFLSPIIYPFTEIGNPRYRQIMMLNPFTQVMQDFRAIIIHDDPTVIVAPAAFTPLRVLPLAIVAFMLVLGIYMFKRDEPWLPERV